MYSYTDALIHRIESASKTNWKHRCGYECSCTSATIDRLIGKKPMNAPCYDWSEVESCITGGHFPIDCTGGCQNF